MDLQPKQIRNVGDLFSRGDFDCPCRVPEPEAVRATVAQDQKNLFLRHGTLVSLHRTCPWGSVRGPRLNGKIELRGPGYAGCERKVLEVLLIELLPLQLI